ncbi:YihY/virulence factor BrkB family protein [Ramlibacter sp. XY19]|uniref:YihY/virulence factor BrkB family protein n=1 Tax=Ramlibacter paludis TaxID=2908000 RepID=UPI0023DB883B|nr:YihY/virulence factor BrkB family protein [Ramlibacter paludis]MCG2594495.1 YihY/virulence factor BrkB family protein [Ramlibacter paludis]
MAWKDRVPHWLLRAAEPVAPILRAVRLWNGAGGMRMSAAMSFYGILSLAPLLLAIVAILGWWIDREVLEKGLLGQLSMVIGERGAAVLAQTLHSAKQPAQGITASLIGFVVLLFGATGVFNELQAAFEQVWAYPKPPRPKAGLRHAAALRLRGIGYILVLGFLLLVSLVISTVLSLFSGWASGGVPLELALRVLNEVVAFAFCAVLFAGLMRLSSGPKPRARYLLAGACLGAIFFTLGRQALAAYLAGAAVVSAYGAAGSLIVLLMWIYFSSAVLLFGAACARALNEQASARQQGAALGEDEGEGGDDADAQQDQQAPAVARVAGPHHA